MNFWRKLTGWYKRSRPPKSLGRRGEDVAAKFLKRLGYKIVARFERNKLGELDIVAVDGRTVIFVEVKTRATHEAGTPQEAVTLEKQKRITRAALGYLRRHGLLEYPARFDVIAVTWPDDQRRPRIDHVQNAFEAVGEGQMFS